MPAWAVNLGGETLLATAATVTAATDRVTVTAHGLSDGDLVVFRTITTTTTLVADAKYYVRNAATNDFQVSATRGGAVVDIDVDGTADVYIAVPSYTAQATRRIFSALLQRGDHSGGFAARSGVFPNAATSNHVSLAGTTWTVNALTAVVNHSTAGPYLVAFEGSTGALDPADGTNPRIDALDLQVRDDDEDASGFRGERVVYVTGTPASSPVAPTVTVNSERLVTILVPAGGSPVPSIQTDPQFTVARGGVIPVEDDTAYPGTGGRYEGMMLWNSATDQLVANTNASSSWAVVGTAGGQQLLDRIVYDTSGDFVKGDYPGGSAVYVEICGAGGGGGGCSTTTSGQSSAGAGGGAGQTRRGWIDWASLAATETVTIGAGGSGGANGTSNPTAGGSSSFGSHIVAAGGNAGESDDTAGTGFSIHSGGSASASGGSGGDEVIPGSAGKNGIHGNGLVLQQGDGGSSYFSGGGRCSSTNGGSNGPDAPGPGAGGSSGYNVGAASSRTGGNGGVGKAVVWVWG